MQNNTLDPLMSAREVAAYLGFALGTVYNKASAGAIPSVHVGGALRFRRSDIERLVTQRRAGKAT